MKKSTKFILISIGTLVVGISAYLTFRPRRFEDNGLSPDTMAEVNALTELDNTTGENKIIVGDTIYPSGSYVNVRYSALVNNGILNNIMMEVESPNAVGIVDDTPVIVTLLPVPAPFVIVTVVPLGTKLVDAADTDTIVPVPLFTSGLAVGKLVSLAIGTKPPTSSTRSIILSLIAAVVAIVVSLSGNV